MLPTEIIQLIINHLPLIYVGKFLSTCKSHDDICNWSSYFDHNVNPRIRQLFITENIDIHFMKIRGQNLIDITDNNLIDQIVFYKPIIDNYDPYTEILYNKRIKSIIINISLTLGIWLRCEVKNDCQEKWYILNKDNYQYITDKLVIQDKFTVQNKFTVQDNIFYLITREYINGFYATTNYHINNR